MGTVSSEHRSDEGRLETPRVVDMGPLRQSRRTPAHHPRRPGNIDRTFGYEPFVDVPQGIASREGCWLLNRNDRLEDGGISQVVVSHIGRIPRGYVQAQCTYHPVVCTKSVHYRGFIGAL